MIEMQLILNFIIYISSHHVPIFPQVDDNIFLRNEKKILKIINEEEVGGALNGLDSLVQDNNSYNSNLEKLFRWFKTNSLS